MLEWRLRHVSTKKSKKKNLAKRSVVDARWTSRAQRDKLANELGAAKHEKRGENRIPLIHNPLLQTTVPNRPLVCYVGQVSGAAGS